MFAFIRFVVSAAAIAIRRSHLNGRYRKDPLGTSKEVLRKFEVFLQSGHSPLSKNYFGPQGQGLGPITVSGYMRMIRKTVRDMGVIFPTRDQIVEYMMALKTNGKSFSHRLNSRNMMLHWAYFHGITVEIPRERKPQRVLKNIPTVEDVKNLLSVTRTARERALILTLIRTGLRVSELSHVTISDIDYTGKKITVVQGKNSKDRIVNTTDDCLEALKQYLEKKKPKPGEYIFSKPQIIRRTLKRIAKRTTVVGKVNPHSFRHGYATHAILNGLDLITIQHQLGHSSALTTSKVYINMTQDQQKKKFEQYAPVYETAKAPAELALVQAS
jgi:site-specific recombinase XerD